MQVQAEDGRRPAVGRRAGYILGCVVVPYILSKALPALRMRIRLKLEARIRKRAKSGEREGWLSNYVLENLGTITSPSLVYAATLAVFYFSGSYYQLSKRVFGLRYIFTKRLAEGEQRVGYEVLGVLLVLQMVVQGLMHVRETMAKMEDESRERERQTKEIGHEHANDDQYAAGSQISKTRLESVTHTPQLGDEPRYDLKDKSMMGWIQGKQLRKCTLCLEEMKDPSTTTCGHVFCWICIQDWIKEKTECPLCRQSILSQHVLPLRN